MQYVRTFVAKVDSAFSIAKLTSTYMIKLIRSVYNNYTDN